MKMQATIIVCLVALVGVYARDNPVRFDRTPSLQLLPTDSLSVYSICVKGDLATPNSGYCKQIKKPTIASLQKAMKASLEKKKAGDTLKAMMAADLMRLKTGKVKISEGAALLAALSGSGTPTQTTKKTFLQLRSKVTAQDEDEFLPQEQIEQDDDEESFLQVSGIGLTASTWPAATVPYTTNPALPAAAVRVTDEAVDRIEKDTCITFIPKTTETDFITISEAASTATTSSADALGKTCRHIKLLPAQMTKSIIMHEFGHCLGLMHEHQRADAHTAGDIQWATNNPGFWDGSSVHCGWTGPSTNPTTITNVGEAYQFLTMANLAKKHPAAANWNKDAAEKGTYSRKSVMHYPWCNCMKTTGDKGAPGVDWDASDSATVNALYSCFKIKVKFNGADVELYTNADQTVATLKHKVFKAVKKLTPAYVHLLKGSTALNDNAKKMSELTIAANAQLTLKYETVEVTYDGAKLQIPFVPGETTLGDFKTTIKEFTTVDEAKQDIKKGTTALADDTKKVADLGVTNAAKLTLTKKP